MLLKESKIKVLENFYGLDYIFFGRPVSEISTCCPLVKEEYLSIKGALMSVFVEMLKLMEHSPDEDTNRLTSKELMAEARAAAQLSRNEAERVVSSEKSRNDIKVSVREAMVGDSDVDVSMVVESKIREKAFSLAVDHLLIGGVVSESINLEDLDSWEGEIIEDSYKILRDNLVEAAHDILYNDDVLGEDEDFFDEDADALEEDTDFFEGLKQRIMEDEKKKVTEGRFKDVWGSLKKEREIKKSGMTAVQKKQAWVSHMVNLCKRDAKRGNWPPVKLQSCIQKVRAKS
jgi:hypothetical protein